MAVDAQEPFGQNHRRGRGDDHGHRRGRGMVARFAASTTAALVGRGVLGAILNAPAERLLRRTNFQGAEVSLAGGPALAVGATIGAVVGADSARMAAAVAVAGMGSGAVGIYDDIVGARPDQRAAKGFHGHLAALRGGQVTAGLVKIVGVGAAGLAAAMILERAPSRGSRRGLPIFDVIMDAGIIAGTANLVNLLDLRPGRALKAGMLVAAPLATRQGPGRGVAAATIGASAGLIEDDLGERIMLGDGGANALGALLGTALAARTGRFGKIAAFSGILGLTMASEKVSFTKVIAQTPWLRDLDELGRRSRPTSG